MKFASVLLAVSFSLSVVRAQWLETTIPIPDTFGGLPVTAIGDNAFQGCNQIVTVTGGGNLTRIGADAFKNCMDSGKFAKEISDEAAYGGTLGITGTPTFVLGTVKGDSVEGRKIVGAQPYAAFESLAAEMLRDSPKR